MAGANKRAKLFMKTPNPVYLTWLEGWLLEAREQARSPRIQELTLAVESLKKYPVRLNSAKECIILENFSRKLVDEIEQREKQEASSQSVELGCSSGSTHRTKSPIKLRFSSPKVSRFVKVSPTKVLEPEVSILAKAPKRKASPTKIAFVSSGLRPDSLSNGGSAEFGNQEPFSNADLDEAHRKQLSLVQDLIAPSKTTQKNRRKQPQDEEMDTEDIPVEPETIIFAPGSFKIIMLIDTAEKGFLSSVAGFSDPDFLHEVRHLKVGDYAWVARGPRQEELLLPFLVERKRLDDLSKSVKDGRFSEQKFRLKMSNIPNIIYLIENHNVRGNTQSIVQAISNMAVKDLFTVKETRDNTDSMQYLANLTRFLSLTMVGKTLVSSAEYDPDNGIQSDLVRLPEFGFFFAGMGKLRTFTTKEMFTKQLVQLHGLSADKAWAIVSKYRTPKALVEAFREYGSSLLSDLTYGLLNRKLGSTIGTILFKFYTSADFR